MEVIIEVVNRSHKTIERHRFSGKQCSIGRAYDNDIILSEAHISPHHVLLEEDDEGRWWLIDQDSRNGILNRHHQRQQSPIAIYSGDDYVLGKLHLKFYSLTHPVEETIDMGASESALHSLSRPLPFVLFVLFSFCLFAGYEFIQNYNRWEAREFLPQALGTPLVGLFWAGLWAIAGRVLRHEPRFVAQCVVSFSYLLFVQVLEVLVQNIAFNSGSVLLTSTLIYMLHGFLLAILLMFNLRLATHQKPMSRLATAHVFSWSLILIVWLFTFFNKPPFSHQPRYVGVLQPPSMQWKQTVDLNQFMKQAGGVFVTERVEAEKGAEEP